jgi:hypothetical protein
MFILDEARTWNLTDCNVFLANGTHFKILTRIKVNINCGILVRITWHKKEQVPLSAFVVLHRLLGHEYWCHKKIYVPFPQSGGWMTYHLNVTGSKRASHKTKKLYASRRYNPSIEYLSSILVIQTSKHTKFIHKAEFYLRNCHTYGSVRI